MPLRIFFAFFFLLSGNLDLPMKLLGYEDRQGGRGKRFESDGRSTIDRGRPP
jgi:hypothetical protein